MAFGFFPGALLGDPQFSELGGAGVVTPTNVNCGLALASMVGLPANIGTALTINCGLASMVAQGLPCIVIHQTIVTCGIAVMVATGLPVTFPASVYFDNLECAIAYVGSPDTIPLYDVGDAFVVQAVFTDALTEVPGDPIGLTFRLKDPNAAITTSIVPTRVSLGSYEVPLTASISGTWRLTFLANNVTEEAEFMVSSSLTD